MYRLINLGIAAMLASSGLASGGETDGKQPIPESDQVEERVEEENEGNIEEENEENGEEEKGDSIEEPELIQRLSLEDAINYGMNSSFSLMDIQYQLDVAENMLAGLEYDYKDLHRDLEDLQDQMDDLRELQRETGQRTFQERLMIQDAIESLEEGIEDLEDAMEQARIGTITGKYGQEAAEESIKLSIISNFTGLKMAEEQINFTKQTLETQKQHVHNLKRQYELGAIPRTDYETAERELVRLASQIEQSEDQLTTDTAVFAFNIGIEYHPDLTLEALSLDELQLVEQEIETEELIENSYDMKTAKENLELARYNRDQVYEDDDASEYDKKQADIEVDQQLLKIEQLKVDARNAINSLYSDVKLQYQAMEDAKNEVAYAQEDFQNMKRRYEIGVVSKADYELSETSLKQATFNYEMEKYNYFLLVKQVELLEAGVIPTN